MSASVHFGGSHPVAVAARRLCRAAHPGRRGRVGGVACAPCWESAIRADERFVTECGLPAQMPGPGVVDEIAVELACHGHRVVLTVAERRAAVARMVEMGLPVPEMARRLRAGTGTVERIVTALAEDAAESAAGAGASSTAGEDVLPVPVAGGAGGQVCVGCPTVRVCSAAGAPVCRSRAVGGDGGRWRTLTGQVA